MKAIVTARKAERMRRDAAICEEFVRLRRMGGDKTAIYERLGARYGLDSNYIARIVRKGAKNE